MFIVVWVAIAVVAAVSIVAVAVRSTRKERELVRGHRSMTAAMTSRPPPASPSDLPRLYADDDARTSSDDSTDLTVIDPPEIRMTRAASEDVTTIDDSRADATHRRRSTTMNHGTGNATRAATDES
jgi:hypothetical protein